MKLHEKSLKNNNGYYHILYLKPTMLSSIRGSFSVLVPLLVAWLDICNCQDRISEGIEEGTMKSNEATIHNRGVRLSMK